LTYNIFQRIQTERGLKWSY